MLVSAYYRLEYAERRPAPMTDSYVVCCWIGSACLFVRISCTFETTKIKREVKLCREGRDLAFAPTVVYRCRAK